MVIRMKRVARRFVPTQDIFTGCAIDLGTALALWIGLWFLAPYLPELLLKLANLAVHVLVLMAIWNPLQHMRRTYHKLVKRAFVLVLAAPVPRLEGGPTECPGCGTHAFTDQPDEFSFAEGWRQFGCGLVVSTDGAVSGKCKSFIPAAA